MPKQVTLTHWGTYYPVVQDGKLIAMAPGKDDPDPSPIGYSFPDALNDAVRISQPMIREGFLKSGASSRQHRGKEAFIAVSWEQATKLAATELDRIKNAYGNQAIFGGSYGWASAGRFHHAQSQLHRFLNVAGGYTRSVNTHSHAAAEVLLPHLIGSQDGLGDNHTPWQLIDGHTELFVAFGGLPPKNSQVSAGGVSQHNVKTWLEKVARSGAKFINISPLESDIDATLNPEWLPIRPNTDTALLLGLAHTLELEGLTNHAFLARYTTGFAKFLPYLMGSDDGQPKSADWAATICGIDAGTIRNLARQMANSRTMISMAWSLQRASHGEQPLWMTITLAAMLGQIGLNGGGFGFGYGAANRVGNVSLPFTWPAFNQFKNPVADFIPVARLADMLLHPATQFDYNGGKYTYPTIKMIWWAGGNPFHHQQDINQLVRAWQQPETVIVQDSWWTATARHADIVLPCTTALERNDLGIAKFEPCLVAMRQAVTAQSNAYNDYDIFKAIAAHLGLEQQFTEDRSEMQWIEYLYEKSKDIAATHQIDLPDFADFWQSGEFKFENNTPPRCLLQDFIADPQAYPLNTPSGKIEIFSQTIANFGYEDCAGHAMWFEPHEWLGSPLAQTYPLHLISNQPATRLHSQLDNGSTSTSAKIKQREPARFNRQDAYDRGIKDSDIVRLFNARGACLVGAILCDDIARGCVQLATGAWFDPVEPEKSDVLSEALDSHGNPNVLTLDLPTSRLAQGPIAHTTLIEAELLQGPAPAMKAFTKPVIKTINPKMTLELK